MSISMRLSCNVPRNGCLPRFLRTHGDMNEAMSHASMKGVVEKHTKWLSGAAVHEASGTVSRRWVCVQATCTRGLPGTEHPEEAFSIQT